MLSILERQNKTACVSQAAMKGVLFMKRAPQHDDLLKMKFLAQPTPSPDGSKIAFTVSSANLDENRYNSDLWLHDLASGSTRQLTGSGREKFFNWTPDGSALVFASERGDAPKETTRFWRLPIDGGEAQHLFDLPYQCGYIWPLADGKFLVKALIKAKEPNPEEASYSVFTELPFSSNGSGFTPSRRWALLLWDSSEEKRLTGPDWDVEMATLSPDGSRVLLTAAVWHDVRPKKNSVYEIDLASGKPELKSSRLDWRFNYAGYRNGRIVVQATDCVRGGLNQDYQFFDISGKKPELIAGDLDNWFRDSVCCDVHYGVGERQSFYVRDGQIICLATRGYKSNLYAVESDGAWRALTDLNAVNDFGVAGSTVAFVGHQGLNLQELFVLQGGETVRLTSFNDGLTGELELSKPEHFTYKNDVGQDLDGWIMKPYGFADGKKYPAVFHIHGGPKAAFGEVYFHEMQCWAARGYSVIYTNPRGADGRTDDFDDIRGHYGDWDYSDLMTFVDECLKQAPFIDPAELFVTGGSYGGYMTNWIVGHTDRFKAACAQRSISNWTSMYGSTDIGFFFVDDQHVEGTPWDYPERYWNDSPLKFAANIKTPLLLIHSDKDMRCDMNQATQIFTALKVRGVECRFCLFHEETHELSRSGKPKERLARLREIADWFDCHK